MTEETLNIDGEALFDAFQRGEVEIVHGARDARIEELEARLKEVDKLHVHLQHCNFGEHAGACKYGEPDCPALTETWEWLGWNLQQIKRCDDCGIVMNPIGKDIFECWKCADEAQRLITRKMHDERDAAIQRAEQVETLNGRLMVDLHNAQIGRHTAEARLKEAEGDIEELTFCEDCGEDDTKLKENNCWPPRYCHSCRHKLVEEICELRKRATAAEARAESAEKVAGLGRNNRPRARSDGQKVGGGEVKEKNTDYQRFTASAKRLGAEFVKRLGRLGDCAVEAWYFNGTPRTRGEGFILMRNLSDGTIGVYGFAGKHGAPVDEDIKWLVERYERIREGKRETVAPSPSSNSAPRQAD